MKDRIASLEKPTCVEFVDSLPKNAAGKVLKRELRADADRAEAVR